MTDNIVRNRYLARSMRELAEKFSSVGVELDEIADFVEICDEHLDELRAAVELSKIKLKG